MVYTGKPSTGCLTCRKRRIKCDERRPFCERCTKSKRECQGYRLPQNSSSQQSLSEQCESASESLPLISNANRIQPGKLVVPSSLQDDLGKFALSFYMTEHTLLRRPYKTYRGYMEYLMPIYASAGTKSPLLAAIEAAALQEMSYYKQSIELMQNASRMYGVACGHLQAAIQDPAALRSNDTLMAVLIMIQYITKAATKTSIMQWGIHVDGANALVRHRGKDMMTDPISRRLYWAINHQAVVNQTIKCESMSPFLDWTDLWPQSSSIDLQEDPLNMLTDMAMRLPALREAAWKWLKLPMSSKVLFNLLSLKGNAIAFDEYIQGWHNSLPASFQYADRDDSYTEGSHKHDDDFFQGPFHEYGDVFAATIWNSYRTHRIFCNYVIMNCCERLFPGSALVTNVEYCSARAVVQAMCKDIASSVRYCIGLSTTTWDCMERAFSPTMLAARPSELLDENAAFNARQILIRRLGGEKLAWPLFVASSCPCIPKDFRNWFSGTLKMIGREYGVGQATAMASLGESLDASGLPISLVDLRPLPYCELPDISEALVIQG